MENIIDDKILELENLFDESDTSSAIYTYNGHYIPRVSYILKFCENQESLIEWAASIPKTMFENIRTKATEVGTLTHQYIEDFLRSKLNMPLREHTNPFLPSSYYDQAQFAFSNFISWYNDLERSGYKIEALLGSEYTVVTPYYGGTIDAIVTINGRNYIIDFKTSKAINYSYLIQTVAYRYAINNYYQNEFPHINGIGIIRIDKQSRKYETIFVDELRDTQYLNNLEYCFGSYVESYYRANSIMNTFDIYKSNNHFANNYGEYING